MYGMLNFLQLFSFTVIINLIYLISKDIIYISIPNKQCSSIFCDIVFKTIKFERKLTYNIKKKTVALNCSKCRRICFTYSYIYNVNKEGNVASIFFKLLYIFPYT